MTIQSKVTSSERKKRIREAVDAVKDEPKRKPRLIWTKDLHARFLAVMTVLGTGAKPKHILHTMNVQGLTRQSVASHLQKYRSQCRHYAVPTNSAICSLPFGADGYGMWTWVDEGGAEAGVGSNPMLHAAYASFYQNNPGVSAPAGAASRGHHLRYHPYDIAGAQAGGSGDGGRARNNGPAAGAGAPLNHPPYSSTSILNSNTAGWDTSALAPTQGAPGSGGAAGGHASSAGHYTMSVPATTSGHPLGGPQTLQRL